MNNATLIGLVSGIALVGTTLYWRQRERTVRESLTVSRDWETNTKTNDDEREEQRAARKAAEHLDTRVEDLPERIATLDEERRDLRRELDAVREQWAESWWMMRADADGDTDDPVHVIEFDSGELPDARAFAKQAMNEDGIHLIAAHGDGSFAVGVGEAWISDFNAADIAREIADRAGGGAGGNDRTASGGGGTGALGEICRDVKEELLRTDHVTIGKLR
jgi:alanyl-tRNA synthetase